MTKFWWVNQNQTFADEYAGEYLWAPKVNANGSRNPYYDFMTQVKPEDIIFSFKGTKIAAIAIAITEAYTEKKPFAGNVGSYWQDDGWMIDVQYFEPRNSIRPKDFMEILAPLLPAKYSPIRADGAGNQIYFAPISEQMARVLLDLVDAPPLERPVVSLDDLVFDPEEQEIRVAEDLSERTKATMILARRGQGTFRDRVHLIEKSCRVTKVSASKLLVASHIKPWKSSDSNEKLNGNNGLFLSPHIDKLFNDGWITFTAAGKLEATDDFDTAVFAKWGINPAANFGKFNAEQSYFLEHHQKEIFGSKRFEG